LRSKWVNQRAADERMMKALAWLETWHNFMRHLSKWNRLLVSVSVSVVYMNH
jgi:hypothetical protein